MTLLSVNLFLRFDKCCELKLKDFKPEIFTIGTDEVLNPLLWNTGKCDKIRNLFAMQENVEFFDLDVLPVQMIYIKEKYLNGSQYLFPGLRCWKFCLKLFDRECKFLYTGILRKEENVRNIFRTHVWQKIAYSLVLVGKS